MVLLEPEEPILPILPDLSDSQDFEPSAAAVEPSPPPSAGSLSSVIVNDPGSISDAPWNAGSEIETVRPRPKRRMRGVLLVAACVAGTVALGATAFVTRLRAADFQHSGATANAAPAAAARVKPTAAPATNAAPPPIDTAPEPEREEQPPRPPSPLEESRPPSYVHGPTVSHRMWLGLRRAERCHLDGRAVGSAEVFATFTPEGRVSAARIEGEPLASAPVARCILEQTRAIRIPKFEGDEFTLHQGIVLR